MHNATAPKSSAARLTQLRLVLHLYARPVWQYTLNATQPCLNQRTVRSRHFPTCTRAHLSLKSTKRYLVTHKMTHASTRTTRGVVWTLWRSTYFSLGLLDAHLSSPYSVGASSILLKMNVVNAMRQTVLKFRIEHQPIISHSFTFSSLTLLMMEARSPTNPKTISQLHAPNCETQQST